MAESKNNNNCNNNDQKNVVVKTESVWPSNGDPAKTSTDSCKLVAAMRAVNTIDPAVTNFQEPLAAYLAGDDWVQRIQTQYMRLGVYNSGAMDAVTFRCRLLDEEIMRLCQEKDNDNIRQVVLLGAGMDTRPYRLNLPNVDWYEVDVSAMSNCKKEKMESVPSHLKEHAVVKTQSHHYVPIDLSTSLPDLVTTLEAAGLNINVPILYVAEGLVYYLSTDDNLRLLDALSAPSGSKALVTCIDPALVASVNHPQTQAEVPDAKKFATAWKLDMDEYISVVVQQSQCWRLEKDTNMNEEALDARGLALSNIFGINLTKVSEHLLFLRTIIK